MLKSKAVSWCDSWDCLDRIWREEELGGGKLAPWKEVANAVILLLSELIHCAFSSALHYDGGRWPQKGPLRLRILWLHYHLSLLKHKGGPWGTPSWGGVGRSPYTKNGLKTRVVWHGHRMSQNVSPRVLFGQADKGKGVRVLSSLLGALVMEFWTLFQRGPDVQNMNKVFSSSSLLLLPPTV